ncbi:hypothetical protein FRC07_011594 [Ceratobasidium sp. 392]|nr:hypothetical protein FRC07_011594 [Ceratobasidium sp. 392]
MPPVGVASSMPEGPLDIVLYTGRWWKQRHGSMMNGLQSVAEWKEYFGHPTSKQLGLFNAIQSIGALCGIPPAPFIADKFGRRAGIFTGATITLAGAIVQTLTRNLSTFVAARFLIGFGTTLAMMASPLLISELAYPTHRAPLTALYNCLWFSGSIVAGVFPSLPPSLPDEQGLRDDGIQDPQRLVLAYPICPPGSLESDPVRVRMVHSR